MWDLALKPNILSERRLLKEASVREWLDVVKSVAYGVDDVLDEWRYEILKSQFAKRKVWTLSLSSACNFFPCIVSPHHIAVKISNLNSRLDAIPSLRRDVEYIEYNITTPDIDVSKVKGRDIDKEKVLNLLLVDSSDRLHPICFVGMAWIGKTTLAKLVYNDEMVKTHFEERIWVCVSEPFDKNRILEAILESCLHHTYNYTPILAESRSTKMKIQEFLYARKFLIVLDDVWNEDLDKWMQLKDCLMCGFLGSKILVTTRKENVAKLMGCMDEDIVQIGLLSKMDCWSIFCDIAFICQPSEQRKKLETTGIGIVARCKGLPLAVKTMADLLHFKFLKQEWEYVLGSELWNLEKAKQDIFGPLWLSYNDLSPSLRQCFLYCSTFPKNYRISKDGLISLWMAHGF